MTLLKQELLSLKYFSVPLFRISVYKAQIFNFLSIQVIVRQKDNIYKDTVLH